VTYPTTAEARSGCGGAAYQGENGSSAAGGDLRCAGRDHWALESLSVNTCSKGCIDGKRG
jgi:hypothetical protein